MKKLKKLNKWLWSGLLLVMLISSLAIAGCSSGLGNMNDGQQNLSNNKEQNLQIQNFAQENAVKESAEPNPEDVDISLSQKETANKVLNLDLFFGYSLEDKVTRQIPATLGVGRAAINQLILGPQLGENKRKVIPDGTVLKSVKLVGDTMEVNFSRELRDNHWGGVYEEYRTVYAIVNTLTQFPQVKQVQILVEGQKIKSISAGYIDLTQPLSRNTEITDDLISSRYLQLTREKPEAKLFDWDKFLNQEGLSKKHLTNGEVLASASGDLEGSGSKELALTFNDRVEIWKYGQGTVRKLDKVDTPNNPCEALIKDVTGDGRGELLLFNSTDLTVYSWSGEKLEEKWWLGPVGGEIVNLYVEDLDSNGKNELVILRKQPEEKDNSKFINTIEIWEYTDNNDFVKKLKNTVFPFYNLMLYQENPGETVDIIGVGKTGLAAFNWNGLSYIERFRNPVIKGSVALGHTDKNNKLDLVCVDEMGLDVYFYEKNGDKLEKKWQTGSLTGDRLAQVVAIADWDNDGRIETIVSTNAEGGYLVFYPVEEGYRNYTFREGNGKILQIDDLDGDGKQEVVISYHKSNNTPSIYVLRLTRSLID
ncbi:MAG TPA: hypothetical protein GXX38_04165 [Clostridia bacterium]|nr:hypothetical protein [Clostridia bacterium]